LNLIAEKGTYQMIVKLAHVCIHSDDLPATEAFYGYLGINRTFEFRNLENELIGMYLEFGDNTYIEIVKVSEREKQGIINHFAIEVEDVEAVRNTLLDKGVEVTEKRLGGDNTWMVTCHDPNGIFIEFHEYSAESMQKIGGTCVIDYHP
jgi:catechol 2,3-dioxygenase-like lactoylglutathione lyase family enzyme